MSVRRTLARTGLTAGLAVAFPFALGTPGAVADPKAGQGSGFPITLTCGSATYDAVVSERGEFTPAHDRNSSKVFVPHEFRDFHGEIRDPSGTLVDSFDEFFTSTQGSGNQPKPLTCTFSFTEVSDGSDPNLPPAGYTFTGSGQVLGQVSGRK